MAKFSSIREYIQWTTEQHFNKELATSFLELLGYDFNSDVDNFINRCNGIVKYGAACINVSGNFAISMGYATTRQFYKENEHHIWKQLFSSCETTIASAVHESRYCEGVPVNIVELLLHRYDDSNVIFGEGNIVYRTAVWMLLEEFARLVISIE
jgi:hypothetical protein